MVTSAEYQAFYDSLIAANVAPARARSFADEKFKRTAAAADVPVVDQAALEKSIEHAGDVLMQKLGFEVIRFSHPGKTKQTEGIADRRYYHRGRQLAVWWEAKSATGVQRPGQKLFQELVTACGEPYVLGTHDDLMAWLVDHRIATRVVTPRGDVLEPLPY